VSGEAERQLSMLNNSRVHNYHLQYTPGLYLTRGRLFSVKRGLPPTAARLLHGSWRMPGVQRTHQTPPARAQNGKSV